MVNQLSLPGAPDGLDVAGFPAAEAVPLIEPADVDTLPIDMLTALDLS